MKNSVMTDDEIINEDEINLLDYWRVLIKRKTKEYIAMSEL